MTGSLADGYALIYRSSDSKFHAECIYNATCIDTRLAGYATTACVAGKMNCVTGSSGYFLATDGFGNACCSGYCAGCFSLTSHGHTGYMTCLAGASGLIVALNGSGQLCSTGCTVACFLTAGTCSLSNYYTCSAALSCFPTSAGLTTCLGSYATLNTCSLCNYPTCAALNSCLGGKISTYVTSSGTLAAFDGFGGICSSGYGASCLSSLNTSIGNLQTCLCNMGGPFAACQYTYDCLSTLTSCLSSLCQCVNGLSGGGLPYVSGSSGNFACLDGYGCLGDSGYNSGCFASAYHSHCEYTGSSDFHSLCSAFYSACSNLYGCVTSINSCLSNLSSPSFPGIAGDFACLNGSGGIGDSGYSYCCFAPYNHSHFTQVTLACAGALPNGDATVLCDACAAAFTLACPASAGSPAAATSSRRSTRPQTR